MHTASLYTYSFCFFHCLRRLRNVLADLGAGCWKTEGQLRKGISVFVSPKRSKVNNAYSLYYSVTRLNLISWNHEQFKLSIDILVSKENTLLTFDVLWLLTPFSTDLPFLFQSILISYFGGCYFVHNNHIIGYHHHAIISFIESCTYNFL